MCTRSPFLPHPRHHGPSSPPSLFFPSPRYCYYCCCVFSVPQTPTTRFLGPLSLKKRNGNGFSIVGSAAKVPSSSDGESKLESSGEGSSTLDLLGLKREMDTDEDEEEAEVGAFEDWEVEELAAIPGATERRGGIVVDFSDDDHEEVEGEELAAIPGASERRGGIAVDFSDDDDDDEEVEGEVGKFARGRRRMSASGRQIVRRSSLMAKQVISARSACGIGFVSQIWVDTPAWLVAVLETKLSILSAESEKFLLEDVCQVGDVILIEDETVAEYEVNMAGLDTLIGYNLVTTDGYAVGKVRDFNFNINSGAVESLEVDPFGLSIIPASLVSTYSLLVEDILEIRSDKIVIHDGAVSRMQRLSKGLWDTRSSRYSGVEVEEFSAFQRRNFRDLRSGSGSTWRRKVRSKARETEDDWDLPLEY